MKATGKLLVAALAAAGLGITALDARADRGHSGGATHFSGSHGGHWSGGYRGGYVGPRWYGGGYRSRWYGPRVGFFFGVPVVLGLGYWGSPYYWDYPRETVVYREVIREPAEGEVRDAPSGSPEPRSEPAPSSGPLYMNYCESAKAFYPKVRNCPEGWKFITPT